MKNKIKEYTKKYKGFSIILLMQSLFILVFIIGGIAKKITVYDFNSNNLIAEDSNVEINEEGTFYITGKSDEESLSRWIITSDKIYLPYGVYELEANYVSMLHDIDNGGGNCDDKTADIQLISENNYADLQYSDIALNDGSEQSIDRIWVRSFTGIDDVMVKVKFYGMGDLYLKNITIKELPAWRFVVTLAWLMFFAMIDVLYVYFFIQKRYKNKLITAGLISIIVFSSLPLLTDFLFLGHDMNFHVARIWSLAKEIGNGHWISPIQTEMLNGYGYASPIFYSPLFLYFPAILYCMAVPLQVCYQVYAVIVNVATCLITYVCIKGLLKDRYLALFGSCIYTLSPYRLMDLYIRAALGEYTAMIFLPLILCGFANIYMTDKKEEMSGGVLKIVIGLTGLIQCHVLSCEICALFIAFMCIIRIRKTLQPCRFIMLVKAALLTLAINLGFLLPFLQSMRMNLRVKSNGINKIQDQGTYLMQIIGIFSRGYGGSFKEILGDMPLVIGFPLVMGLIIFWACCVKKQEWELDNKLIKLGSVCAGFAVISMIFSLRIFPWDSLQIISGKIARILCMIQFPWRYLSMGTVFCLFASVIGIKMLGNYNPHWKNICYGVMTLFVLISAGYFYMDYGYNALAVRTYGIPNKEGYISNGEYLLTGTLEGELNWRNIVTDESCVTVTDYDYTNGVTTFWCKNISVDEKTVEIPLLNYDNYHAYALSSGEELSILNGDNNYINVVVKPDYEGAVRVQYEVPLLWKCSYGVSVLAAIGIIANVIYKKRGKGRQHALAGR